MLITVSKCKLANNCRETKQLMNLRKHKLANNFKEQFIS